MAKIVLSPVTNGNTLTALNANFQKIASELQNKVLYRDNPKDETNTMVSDLDMNQRHIFNLPAPTTENEPARLKDVKDAIGNQATAVLTSFSPAVGISATNVQGAIEEVAGDINGVFNTLGLNTGASQIGWKSSLAGTVIRTVANKISDFISPKDFGAVGDGATNDSAAFATLESQVAGRVVDLGGASYVLSAYPLINTYVNGTIVVGGIPLQGAQNKSTISGLTDTGAVDLVYTGGVIPLPTTSGRTTDHTYALIASQNCKSEGPSRAVNVGSIYSWAKGNVSGNYSSRQSLAWVPQSANLASEECWVWGGFRGANIASIYSGCENESNANLAARQSYATGRNSVNIATVGTYAGRGGGARFSVTVTGGAVTSVTVLAPGAKYQTGDVIKFQDRTGGGTGAAATVAVVDGNGSIITLSAVTGGSGYSANVDATVDNGTGDFSANIASTGACVTSGEATANISSFEQITSGLRSASIASQNGTTSGSNAAQIASNTGVASGDQSAVIASNGSTASAVGSVVIGGNNSIADQIGSVVIGRRVKPGATRALSYGDGAAGAALTANRRFEVLTNGNVTASGSFTGSTVYTDYAEYFENLQNGEIPLGVLVTLDGRKVRRAQDGDLILGVVSGTALVAAGDSPFYWGGRYLTGEFGEALYEDVQMVRWSNDSSTYDGAVYEAKDLFDTIPDNAVMYTEKHPKQNPDYDSSLVNVPRSQRPDEWSCVGLLGQVHIRVSSGVQPGDWIKAGIEGVGTKSTEPTNIRCMEIRKPYNDEKGYSVAFCLLK